MKLLPWQCRITIFSWEKESDPHSKEQDGTQQTWEGRGQERELTGDMERVLKRQPGGEEKAERRWR